MYMGSEENDIPIPYKIRVFLRSSVAQISLTLMDEGFFRGVFLFAKHIADGL
jgi:hypothetical protein